MKHSFVALSIGLLSSLVVYAAELHVSPSGNDNNPGTLQAPIKTINAAAQKAHPGDVITVHAGVYREQVNPPRGGTSPEQRITYQAAPGEKAIIKGSEVVKGWTKAAEPNVWSVKIPHSFFGRYMHPFRQFIEGDWFHNHGRMHHTGAIFIDGQALFEVPTKAQVLNPKPLKNAIFPQDSLRTWYVESDNEGVTLWINTQGKDPNATMTEITTRSSCFYPEDEGVNYITLKGFEICQAATQWGAPTAHQVGMVSTHWNKGWIIEDNIIHDSRCNGITLGKEIATGHNLECNETDKNGTVHYIEVTFRTLKKGWNKENIGSHIVRNNVIYNCEQTGICGSMGCAFSTIENNHIYNIWTQRQFGGFEIAGIKFHGAIDVTIRNNHIHQASKGIWLDWMAQGIRVSCNLLYDNDQQDLFLEVDHGPGLIDNNIMLSPQNVLAVSEGYAFAHNFFGGTIAPQPDHSRATPYHLNHSTSIKGYEIIRAGDDRFYYNIFAPLHKQASTGLERLANYPYPSTIKGNLYFAGLKPVPGETDAIETQLQAPNVQLQFDANRQLTSITLPWDNAIQLKNLPMVTTQLLGRTRIPKCLYENPDSTPIVINTDIESNARPTDRCIPGPVGTIAPGKSIKPAEIIK